VSISFCISLGCFFGHMTEWIQAMNQCKLFFLD
jgi:hypothetical protein